MSDDDRDDSSFSDTFRPIRQLLEQLSEVADAAEQIGGSIGGEDDPVRGVWGIRVNTFGGDHQEEGSFEVDSFGDVRADDQGDVVVDQIRTPIVDVFEEGDRVRLVAEMPGIDANDVDWQIDGDVMAFEADNGQHRYRKELLLPQSFDDPRIHIHANNGLVEFICMPDIASGDPPAGHEEEADE